jgi:hypothetical protein
MKAWFRANGLWRIVDGSIAKPMKQGDVEPSPDALEAYQLKADKAAGHLYLMWEDGQKIFVSDCQDDPCAMWIALDNAFMQKKPGTRFNAYDDLFSIRKLEEESLQSLMNRVDDAVKLIQDLRPKDFTLALLDKELAALTLIKALPEEYSGFTSSLMLLDKLNKETVHQAFLSEDAHRRRRAGDAPASALAASAISSAIAAICDFCG